MATMIKGFKVILRTSEGDCFTVLTDYEPSLEDDVIKFRLEDDGEDILYRQARLSSFSVMEVYIIY